MENEIEYDMEESEKLLKQIEWSDEELKAWLSEVERDRLLENEMLKEEFEERAGWDGPLTNDTTGTNVEDIHIEGTNLFNT